MDRRAFLRTTGIASSLLLAGCSSNEDASDDDTPATEGAETTTRTDGPSTTDSTEDGSQEEDTTDEPPTADELTPPEPTFTVAADGSADYETLSEAMRVSQGDDVIGIAPGEYSIESFGSAGTLVGAGKDETTVTVTESEERAEIPSREFWDLTLSTEQETFEQRKPNGEGDRIRIYRSRISDPVGETVSFGGIGNKLGFTEAVDTDFEGELSNLLIGKARNCTFPKLSSVWAEEPGTVDENGIRTAPATQTQFVACAFTDQASLGPLGQFAMSQCQFEDTFELDVGLAGRIDILHCRFANGISLVDHGQHTDLEIKDCIIGANSDNVALRGNAGNIHSNTIRGQVTGDYGEFVGNYFESETDVAYFVDGSGPSKMVGNAFLTGDIRISDVAYPVEINDDLGSDGETIGNYYAEWDGADDADGDGIADLPRPIPGEGEVTDRHPLASSDLDQYLDMDANKGDDGPE